MKCQFCGEQIADDSLFCTSCGKKQEKKEVEKETKMIRPLFCTSCGSKLNADALFCTNCGAKIEERQEKKQSAAPNVEQAVQKNDAARQTEPNAGTIAGGNRPAESNTGTVAAGNPPAVPNPGAEVGGASQQFTPPNPGAEVGEASQQFTPPNSGAEMAGAPQQFAPQSFQQGESDAKKQTSTGTVVAIIVLVVAIVLLLGIGIFFGVKIFVPDREDTRTERVEEDDRDREDQTTEKEDQEDATSEEATTESEPAAADQKADYDISSNDTLTLKGYVRNSTSGYIILQWSDGASFLGKNDVLLEDIRSARMYEDSLPDGLFDWIEADEEIEITGKVAIENDDKVAIQVATVKDSKGKDLVEEYEKQGNLSDDYIIPNSDTKRLSESDIKNLTLQELNYAKNEIYARHGRKFDSKELRTYFESKSWYKGTIDPNDFRDDMLSKIERDNVTLIKNKEFSINPNGYPLDQ